MSEKPPPPAVSKTEAPIAVGLAVLLGLLLIFPASREVIFSGMAEVWGALVHAVGVAGSLIAHLF